MTGEFSLEVPPEPIHLGTARTFASRVAAHLGCSDDTVLDVKLAVSEACSSWMSRRSPDGTVGIRVRPDIDGLRIEITGSGSIVGASDPEFAGEGPTRLELIRSVFADVSVTASNGERYAVRFSVPIR